MDYEDGDHIWGVPGACMNLSDESCARTYQATGRCGYGCTIKVEHISTNNDDSDNSFEGKFIEKLSMR